MITEQEQQEGFSVGNPFHISSDEEMRQTEEAFKAAKRAYEQRKPKVRRILGEVLVSECGRADGWLAEMLSEGYTEQTGEKVEAGMVSDFLAGLPDRLFPPKPKTKSTPKRRKASGPRPTAVVALGGEERAVTGGWAGAFRYIALAVAKDNPGRTEIWERLQFVQPRDQLPDYLREVVSNVEVAPGLWLNTHGNAEATRRKTREMLEAFQIPANRWRVRLDNGRWQTI